MLKRISAWAIAPLIAPAAIAQVAQPLDSGVFEAGYFTQFNPTTALDMVQRLPGFTINEIERNVRGFAGTAGNVLINGERPSTKQGLAEVLQRIPADSVVRINIVTQSSAGLDMRGQTKIANVIVAEVAEGRAPVNWNMTLRRHEGGPMTAQVQANTTFKAFGGSLTLDFTGGEGLRRGAGRGARDISGRSLSLADGTPLEAERRLIRNDNTTIEPAFEFERDFDWGALRLNGLWEGCCASGSTFTEIFEPDLGGSMTAAEAFQSEEDEKVYSLGGDVERKFDGGSAKLIFLHDRFDEESRNSFEFIDGSGALIPTAATMRNSASEGGESIVRGQTNFSMGNSHAVEIALEGAYNFLDSTSSVQRGGTDVTPPGSDTIVEELRGEIQVSDVWQVSPTLTVEPGVRVEVSEIQQEVRIADGENFTAKRSFVYPKPSLTASWRISPQQQLRLSAERTVAQLNFRDFVSERDVDDERTEGGNTQLEPQRAWEFVGEYEHSFWGDGVFTLEGSYARIEDVEDLICIVPVTADPDDDTPCVERLDSVDGPGNLGDGTRWLVSTNVSLPLERIGVAGARLDLGYRFGASEVVDPFTGDTRKFSNDSLGGWSAEFRQDLPGWQLSYGVVAEEETSETAYRLDEIFTRSSDGVSLDLFVETTRFWGLNVRAGYNDVFTTTFRSRRVFFDAPRSIGQPERVLRSFTENGPFAYLRIAGSF